MTLDNMIGRTKGSYTGGDLFCKSQLITCNRVKECNGVCPFEDALKHADKIQTINEQHTVDHDRDWIIGCIKHDGFIKTDRFDKANQIILEALSADVEWIPCSDRLPSESGTYLVTTAKGAVWADHFYANSVDDRHWSYRTRRVPIAWMPMPKPYKGGDTE